MCHPSPSLPLLDLLACRDFVGHCISALTTKAVPPGEVASSLDEVVAFLTAMSELLVRRGELSLGGMAWEDVNTELKQVCISFFFWDVCYDARKWHLDIWGGQNSNGWGMGLVMTDLHLYKLVQCSYHKNLPAFCCTESMKVKVRQVGMVR